MSLRSPSRPRRKRRTRDPPLPPPCEEEHVAGPASAQTLQQPDVSSLKDLLDTTTLEESSIAATSPFSSQANAVAQDSPQSGLCLSSSPGSRIWSRLQRDWGFTFYIRVDLRGFFHTYPHLGGLFQSLQEADDAIDRHSEDRRVSKVCMEKEKVSPLDMVIQECLYWPDGTRKKRSKSHVIEETRNEMSLLVQALIDKYNENHNLSGHLAYELKDVLRSQSICEKHIWYYHLNFTTRTTGADGCDIDDLFFAEVKRMQQGKHEELVVTCFCIVKPIDNGHCKGCMNNGSVDMKHPNSADEYAGGHLDTYLPFGAGRVWNDSDDDDDVKAEVRLRHMYEGLGDDPHYWKKIFTFPSYVTVAKD